MSEVSSVVRLPTHSTAEDDLRQPGWPSLSDTAQYGLPGRFIHALQPHTEADQVAILVQFLAAFGNCIGRGPHFRAEADKHRTNLFVVLVGETSKARKGSSWGHIRRLFQSVDPDWADKRTAEGLSSGEGLIWQVRDPIRTIDQGKKVSDPGISDKRLLLVESEYAGVLKVMTRRGNTLSPTIRRAWDQGNLESLTKNSPARASGAHISIVGHITSHELRRHLTETEAASGFANRHLFCCVRRSKCLPDGGQWSESLAEPFVEELSNMVAFCGALGDFELKRDEEARTCWHEVYPELSEGRLGMAGAIAARAEAQAMRIAVLYALLDGSVVITKDHLLAGLALWQYCEDSVNYVFGSAHGDPTCDTITEALEESGELTRTAIRDLFARHTKKADIDRALRVLSDLGIAQKDSRPTGGRPTEVWRLMGGN